MLLMLIKSAIIEYHISGNITSDFLYVDSECLNLFAIKFAAWYDGFMKKKIEIVVANPSGNITIFVKTPCIREQYQKIATQLLALEELGAEQVAFVRNLGNASADSTEAASDLVADIDGAMDMCGMEFCGNASRAFALMLAQDENKIGKISKRVQVSGCEEPLTVEVDMESQRAKIRMPNPKSCEKIDGKCIVDFGGILHMIVEDEIPSEECFKQYCKEIYKHGNPPAVGVMFWDSAEEKMTPVVYVKDVDTVYFEGSCGSGTTALAAARALDCEDGTYTWSVPQPEGIIDVTAVVRGRNAEEIYIDSTIAIGEPMTMEVEI